jgi:hypothetical protein
MEAVIWQLALRLLFEVPEADPALIPMVQGMADKVLLEAEHEEGDGAPIVLGPNISVYTK